MFRFRFEIFDKEITRNFKTTMNFYSIFFISPKFSVRYGKYCNYVNFQFSNFHRKYLLPEVYFCFEKVFFFRKLCVWHFVYINLAKPENPINCSLLETGSTSVLMDFEFLHIYIHLLLWPTRKFKTIFLKGKFL